MGLFIPPSRDKRQEMNTSKEEMNEWGDSGGLPAPVWKTCLVTRILSGSKSPQRLESVLQLDDRPRSGVAWWIGIDPSLCLSIVPGFKPPRRGSRTPTILISYYFLLSIPLVEEDSVNLGWCKPLATVYALFLATWGKKKTWTEVCKAYRVPAFLQETFP